jgi:hypothetical protein
MSTLQDRLWEKVNKNGPVIVEELGPCWEWTGSTDTGGYGHIRAGGKIVKASRLVYLWEHGALDASLKVLHRCNNRRCVRPSHLYEGTQAQNIQDAIDAGHWAPRGAFSVGDKNHKRLYPPSLKGGKEAAEAMRKRHAKGGISYKALGGLFGVSTMQAWRIIHGMHW